MPPARQRPRRPKTEAQKLRAKRAAAAREKAKLVRHKAKRAPAKQAEGFMNFIRTQGVIGLAIGLVLGTQIKAVVDQLIASFINPLLGLVLPGEGDLNQKTFTLVLFGKKAVFAYGAFIFVLLSFLIVAIVIYYIVKLLRLDKLQQPAPK